MGAVRGFAAAASCYDEALPPSPEIPDLEPPYPVAHAGGSPAEEKEEEKRQREGMREGARETQGLSLMHAFTYNVVKMEMLASLLLKTEYTFLKI